jgi:hypothetical protein
MPFYDPAHVDGPATFTRRFTDEAALALSAIDSILNGETAVYASSELTSGRRLNTLLRETGTSRASELRERIGESEYQLRLWTPNVVAATTFARELHHRLKGEVVITPAPYSAPGWTQQQYLSFWEVLLRSRITRVYFNDGWYYSHGCTFEFAVALDAGLPTYDVQGRPLSAAEGVALVEQAARECDNPQPLIDNLARIKEIVCAATPHPEAAAHKPL